MPSPSAHLRLLSLSSVPFPNFWSRHPLVRMDLAVGAYDEISSAEVAGLPEALVAAVPPLAEHACSVGRPGGFVERLRRGTYAPHVMEHVALALQERIGHDVGFGRARGGDEPGTYTVVFRHRHEVVGLRAGALAFDLVRRAFGGALTPADGEAARAELAALARTPYAPPPAIAVRALVTGGRADARAAAAAALRAALGGGAAAPDPDGADLVVDVDPAALLAHGLPWARAGLVLLLDAELEGLAERWREPDRAARLLGVACDAAQAGGGVVVAPSDAPMLHAECTSRGLPLACFPAGGDAAAVASHAVAAALEALRAPPVPAPAPAGAGA